jgi:hypothetical protein
MIDHLSIAADTRRRVRLFLFDLECQHAAYAARRCVRAMLSL